ncbi:DUF763 domain-containing protein [bacterium]|nr:DUF763 domain-containing protein [bacterium]
MHRGVATFTLDYGKCPTWLFERMVKLGREIVQVLIDEYGPDEFVKRIADPVWFQSLGTVLAFDWNASGLTTIFTAALKEAIRGQERQLGVFICGGKGKTSLKTPEQIENWGSWLSLPDGQVSNLVYNSKMSAKVDSALVQDGFDIYHHAFFFSKNGAWAVVQQGMNKIERTARRYHWSSDSANDLIVEPHKGIVSDPYQRKLSTLNMTAKDSGGNRDLTVDMISQGGYFNLMKDIQVLRKHSSHLSKMVSIKVNEDQLTLLELAPREFKVHPVMTDNFNKSKYLDKILWKICDRKPGSYENLLSMKGVGPKTIRALSLVSEVVYGAPASYKDPARYSFAHGGKDATPYPVNRRRYDESIEVFKKAVEKTRFGQVEKRKMIENLTIFPGQSTSPYSGVY